MKFARIWTNRTNPKECVEYLGEVADYKSNDDRWEDFLRENLDKRLWIESHKDYIDVYLTDESKWPRIIDVMRYRGSKYNEFLSNQLLLCICKKNRDLNGE